MKIKFDKTYRGFRLGKFTDLYGVKCSIQKSSLATDDAIWLGVDDAEPKILASQASNFGVQTSERTGWVSYPIPHEVSLITRMHINKIMAKNLIKVLQKFVDTGEI